MESLEFTFKQHYDAEQFWLSVHYWIGIPATFGTASTAALATADVPITILVGIATVSAILIALVTFLRPDQNATKHRQAAANLQALHERIRGWLSIDAENQSTEVQAERMAAIRAERATLLSCSPGLPKWTYRRVKKGIESGESEFKADSE